jgi:signal transduction histidine kinase
VSAADLVQYLAWTVYIVIFLRVVFEAIRAPRRANINIALLFALTTPVIAVSALSKLRFVTPTLRTGELSFMLVLALSYVLLRLVDDFATVPAPLMRAMEISLVLLCAGLFFLGQAFWLIILAVIYFVGLQMYAAITFVRASQRSSGVTKRRMRAVAMGSVFLGLTILIAILTFLGTWQMLLVQVCSLASAVSYFVGFTPPRWLRRAWQEPELRAFLGRAASLPRLPKTQAIVEELERGAARSVGAPHAVLGLWDAEARVLRFALDGTTLELPVSGEGPARKAFLSQRPLFVADTPREYPAVADASKVYGSKAVLVAPVTAGEKRLGVLSVYAPRAPIFAQDDLELVQLLADQAAVILESRALIDEAARVQAREEATRLKDDFLSAAAHDLKTPLTTLVSRAQLLERRARRAPNTPADLASIQAIVSEALRLRTLVLELLDAARAERGQLVGVLEPVDLVVLAEEACARRPVDQHHFVLEARGPAVGLFDRNRIGQLIDNLLENAAKYSPKGGDITTTIWCEDHTAHLAVADQGIGIPAEDLPHIFDRFYRATNVNDRQFAGMGLGLFICRAIVEQHGGTITVQSRPGEGTTFHVALPVLRVEEKQNGQTPNSGH